MIRAPAVAGSFYAGETESLKEQIENCFKSELGPGLPKAGKGKKILAGVSPHAGYMYSGPIAAHLYKQIAESEQAKTYVILGPNHTGVGTGVSIMINGKWATPLGQVEVNSELANKIEQESDLIIADDMAHAHEHSIEVQLPFLQFVQKSFKIVPICMMMQNQDTALEVGKAVSKVCKSEDVTVIASSDFTHYEPAKFASEKDMQAIKAIESLDLDKFYEILVGNDMSVCGFGPIAVAMTYAKECGAKKGTLLKYADSGDTTGDKTAVVGYAAILFE